MGLPTVRVDTDLNKDSSPESCVREVSSGPTRGDSRASKSRILDSAVLSDLGMSSFQAACFFYVK